MLKETETEETIGFFVTLLSLVASQLGEGGWPPIPPGYAYIQQCCFCLLHTKKIICFSIWVFLRNWSTHNRMMMTLRGVSMHVIQKSARQQRPERASKHSTWIQLS